MAAVVGAPFLNPLFQVISFGAGTALGPVLRPVVQSIANETWAVNPVRPLGAQEAAAMAVEGVWSADRAHQEGLYTGHNPERIDALRQLLDNPPDVATLMSLWRRGLIDGNKFVEGLRHLRLESDYFEAIRQTHNQLLTPEALAAARVKGHIDQQRQYDEAALWGVTNDRAQIMYETTGNPPGPETLITMLNRNIITEAEFAQGIKQGNIRPEYVDEYLALRHHLLTPHEVVNLRLRGWIDASEMNARGAQLGYTNDAMHDLFLGQGRPISFRQVFIGQRRGGVYDGPTGSIDPPFLKSLQESNIRPEWYSLAWAQRHSLPSAFVLRALTQSGDIDETTAERLLLWMGWPEDLAASVSASWAGGTSDDTKALTKAEYLSEFEGGFMEEAEFRTKLADLGYTGRSQDLEVALGNARRVKASRDRALLALEKKFAKGDIGDAEAGSFMTELEIPAAARAQLLEVWNIERRIAAA